MILRPIAGVEKGWSPDQLGAQIKNTFISSQRAGDGFEPSWAAIARTQDARAETYLLITQPAHARLAGEVASQFRAEFLPAGAAAYWREIAVHDDGWLQFEAERDPGVPVQVSEDGRPLSFVEVEIEQSLTAWAGSIAVAEEVSPMGAYMVSGHFTRLARGRLDAHADHPARQRLIAEFVAGEERRQERVTSALQKAEVDLREYVDLLQFCDTLSLYVCCGATAAVEFPQRFGGKRLRAKFEDGVYVTEPSLFERELRFNVAARTFPSNEPHQVEVRIK